MHSVVVTGGSRGLGLGIARTLANAGYDVVAIARRQTEPLAAAIAEAGRDGRGAIAFRACDLAELGEIAGFVRGLRAEFGHIFGLVNNAGVGPSGVLTMMPDSRIEETVRLNTLSPVILTKYVARSMMAAGAGRIVNIASIVGATGYSGLSVYGATKAALVGLTRSLARELGPLGITVNAIAPGFIDTEMTHELGAEHRDQIKRRSALRRLADIEDVAGAVEFLMSDKAKNITGTVVTIDAGNTA
jgi:3-oxoacyl-[acyl-carrier protein] reductase